MMLQNIQHGLERNCELFKEKLSFESFFINCNVSLFCCNMIIFQMMTIKHFQQLIAIFYLVINNLLMNYSKLNLSWNMGLLYLASLLYYFKLIVNQHKNTMFMIYLLMHNYANFKLVMEYIQENLHLIQKFLLMVVCSMNALVLILNQFIKNVFQLLMFQLYSKHFQKKARSSKWNYFYCMEFLFPLIVKFYLFEHI